MWSGTCQIDWTETIPVSQLRSLPNYRLGRGPAVRDGQRRSRPCPASPGGVPARGDAAWSLAADRGRSHHRDTHHTLGRVVGVERLPRRPHTRAAAASPARAACHPVSREAPLPSGGALGHRSPDTIPEEEEVGPPGGCGRPTVTVGPRPRPRPGRSATRQAGSPPPSPRGETRSSARHHTE